MKRVAFLASLIFFVLYNVNGQIPTDSLIGFWPFNGNANDMSINNNHGTVSGATLVSDRFGISNRAYHFDGNDYISIPHSTTLNMQDSLSFSVWVKPESLVGTSMIFGKSNYTTKTNYLLRIKPNGYIQWEYDGYTDTDSLPLQLNAWHHIVVTTTGPGLVKRIYINNQLVKETLNSSGPFGTITNPFTIGYASYNSEYFIGAIDDIRMYNKVLSESEINALFNESCNSLNSITETACDSYTAPDGAVYTTSGIKTAVIPNAAGCDSTITIDLTINNSTTSSITETACDSYTAPDGAVYTTSGIKTAVIPNAAGCDSTITIDLTINNSTTSSITETACDSYTAPDGAVYTTSGIKTAVIPNAAGCDSTITIDLTINIVDVSLTVNDPLITANANGAIYQWLDCDNAFAIIPGATSQNYTAPANGNYAVMITQGMCTDTSACVEITTVGIITINTNGISIYPNPVPNELSIEIIDNKEKIDLVIFNSIGQVVFKGDFIEKTTVQTSNFAPGVYLIKLENGKIFEFRKVIKE